MSIAVAMVEMVNRYVEPHERVERVRMKAGPLRGIDADTMALAWRAATMGTHLDGSALEMETPLWTLRCAACGREWESETLDAACACGHRDVALQGGDELLLLSIDVNDDETAANGAEEQL